MNVQFSRSKASSWSRSYSLLLAIIVSAVLPYVFRLVFVPAEVDLAVSQTLAANFAAVLIGTWVLQNVTTYPGVESTAYTLPAFTTSYGIILCVLIIGRLDYSRAILILGFITCVIAFYIALFRRGDAYEYVVAYTPFVELGELRGNDRITWVEFFDPSSRLPMHINAVVTDLRSDVAEDWDRALADLALRGVPVYHIKHLRESVTGKVDLEHLSENNFGSLSPVSAYMNIKSVVDIVISAVAVPLFLPVFLLCAIAIKLDSKGPVLFTQKRVGYQGRTFTVFKLRTMTADEVDPARQREAAMTQDSDKRVTKVGRFLRKTRLDELPQLLNVLRGEMSWIGPRPEAEILSKWYEAEIAFYLYRHIVKPGITGWAQVNHGHVADVSDVREKLHYDFFYIKNFSFWIDVLIVLRTVRTIVTGRGAR